jgi:hypothetical protein
MYSPEVDEFGFFSSSDFQEDQVVIAKLLCAFAVFLTLFIFVFREVIPTYFFKQLYL